jgi:hypothetical protein
MKKVIILLIVTLHCAFISAQAVIPKDANTVVITDTISAPAKFNQTTTILYENGIGILQSDRETGTILTTPVAFKNGTITLTLLVADNKVTARGQWTWNMTVTLNGVTHNPDPMGDIQYGGQRNSAKRNSWDAFYKIVSQIPGNREYFIR